MKSGVNVAIVVNETIVRLIDSKIFPKDIAKLEDESLRTAQRKFQKFRTDLCKPKGYKPTLREFCLFYPEYDPVYVAHRFLVLGVKR